MRGVAGSGSDSWNCTSASRSRRARRNWVRAGQSHRALADGVAASRSISVSPRLRRKNSPSLASADISCRAMPAATSAPAAAAGRQIASSTAHRAARGFSISAWVCSTGLQACLRDAARCISSAHKAGKSRRYIGNAGSSVGSGGAGRAPGYVRSVVRLICTQVLVSVLYMPQPSSFQSDVRTADSGRKSVQASPGTSAVWLTMSNWPSRVISPIRTGLVRWWLGSMTAVPPVRFGNS